VATLDRSNATALSGLSVCYHRRKKFVIDPSDLMSEITLCRYVFKLCF
jgi:hypothetical protein